MDLAVIVVEARDGVTVAWCPSVPGCFGQGANREEALRNVTEAIRLSAPDGARWRHWNVEMLAVDEVEP